MIAEFESYVDDIPCLVRIDTYEIIPPVSCCPYRCSSPDEYYGDEDIEYSILTISGKEAPWLEAKVTGKDDQRIVEEIRDYMSIEPEDTYERAC